MVYPALADGIARRWFRKFSFAGPVTGAACSLTPSRQDIRRVMRVHSNVCECDRDGDQHAERGPRPHVPQTCEAERRRAVDQPGHQHRICIPKPPPHGS